jgi:hypothetical protein
MGIFGQHSTCLVSAFSESKMATIHHLTTRTRLSFCQETGHLSLALEWMRLFGQHRCPCGHSCTSIERASLAIRSAIRWDFFGVRHVRVDAGRGIQRFACFGKACYNARLSGQVRRIGQWLRWLLNSSTPVSCPEIVEIRHHAVQSTIRLESITA